MATKPIAKPMPAKKVDAAAAAEAPAPKNKKKLIIIIAAVVVLLIAAGGAAVFLMKGNNAHSDAPKAEVVKEPRFVPLEAFTVNLQHEEADQYLQINITLKVLEPEVEEKIKAVLPEIRSKLNMLLSSKRPSELSTVEGKKKLATEIEVETNTVLGIHNAAAPVVAAATSSVPAEAAAPTPPAEPAAEAAHPAPAGAEKKGVVDVLFTSFIIQ